MNTSEKFLTLLDQTFIDKTYRRTLERFRRSMLDYVACTLAGSALLRDKTTKYLAFENPSKGNYTAIGVGSFSSLKEVVFLNGLNSHALDFDDGTNAGIIHLGSPIFSTLLPLARKYSVSFDRFFRAVVLGYECSFTLANTIQPRHKELGYHATGTCGVIGVALAIAELLDFTSEERAGTFAASCASASGCLKVLDDGSELKPYNVGKAALLGLTSAQVGKSGFRGSPDPLGGERGFLTMATRQKEIELQTTLLNGTFAIEKTYTKPYAACRYCHPSIDAAIYLRDRLEVPVEKIDHILVKTYSLAVFKHDHTENPTSASAKMSIPYGVAVGLLDGKAGLREYEPSRVAASDVSKLARKVKVVADANFTRDFPVRSSALVEATTLDGKVFSYQVDVPKGEPENPLDESEFHTRFLDLVQYGGKTSAEGERLYEVASGFSGDWEALFALL